jgi:hypothetical protein
LKFDKANVYIIQFRNQIQPTARSVLGLANYQYKISIVLTIIPQLADYFMNCLVVWSEFDLYSMSRRMRTLADKEVDSCRNQIRLKIYDCGIEQALQIACKKKMKFSFIARLVGSPIFLKVVPKLTS